MNKLKNIFKDKILDIKRFIADHIKISAFFAVLVFSFSVYFIAFADTTAKYKVSNVNVVYSMSGDVTASRTLPNFGTLNYTANVTYELESGTPSTDDTITTYVDVYIPNTFTATVASATELTDNAISGYKHYFISSSSGDLSRGDSIPITISNINDLVGGSTFSPIISVRRNENVRTENDISSEFKNVLVTSNLNYGMKVFTGPLKKASSDNKVIIPVGVMVYLPYNAATGIKGLKNISSLKYSINNNIGGNNIALSSSNYTYDASAKSTYSVNGLPIGNDSGRNISVNNNEVSISNISLNLNNKYSEGSEFGIPENSIVVSSNIFLYEYTISSDTTSTVTATSMNLTSVASSISINLYKSVTVGEFESKVDFQNPNETEPSTDLTELYYGQSFTFYVSNNYVTGTTPTGDALSNLITNIKVDEHIKNVEIKNIYLNGTSVLSDYSGGIKYYKGSWNGVNLLACGYGEKTLEMAMNLYGGPCTVGQSFDESTASEEGITLIKFDSSTVSNFSLAPSSKLVFEVSGKIEDNYDLVSNQLQIVTNSTTNVALNNSAISTYYLGKTANTSDEATAKNPNNYVKGTTNALLGNTISVVAGSTSSIDAKTYLASSDNSENSDTNNNVLTEQTSFYAGRDEPIIWRFHPVTNLGGQTSITEITAAITIPKINNYKYLEFSDAFLPKSKDPIFTATSLSTSMPYEEQKCSSDESNSCKYVRGTNSSGETTYTFTITNGSNDNISSFLNNGIFIKTNIDLIANTGEVSIPFELKYKFNSPSTTSAEGITSESTPNTTNGKTNIRVIRGAITNAGTLKLDNTEPAISMQAEKNTKYTYFMNSIINTTGTRFEIINILPYNTETNKTFSGTYTVDLNTLPDGYKAYYISGDLNAERNIETIKDSSDWTLWDGTSLSNTNTIAIKIKLEDQTITSNDIPLYFGGEKNSLSINITPIDNEYGDSYRNTFYMYADKIYDTKESILSIFNRTISGLVFEDFDYDGFYSLGENVLKDLSVELYNISGDSIESISSDSDYSSSGVLVGDAIYTTDTGYKFDKLSAGYYYLKITFNSDKYEVTDYEKEDYSMGANYDGNSKFKKGSEDNIAISKLLSLDSSENLNYSNINLGLKLKQSFLVSIDKYIKNIKVTRDGTTESTDYDHAKQVKLDFRDLNNTTFEVTYGFDIKNLRYYPGYVGAIIEAIPQEMLFDSNMPENVGWQEADNLLYYNGLAETLIMPDETYSFEIKLTIPENLAGDFINVISVGDLRMLETIESSTTSDLEETISTLGITTKSE